MDETTQAPATDDQELAKVLENMNSTVSTLSPVDQSGVPSDTSLSTSSGLEFEETSASSTSATPVDTVSGADDSTIPQFSSVDPASSFQSTNTADPTQGASDDDLTAIKQDAIQELRPLVNKLDVPPEEKFDTLMLLIRSTDDRSLVPSAHAVAKTIEDEGRRAEALFEIIKEVDYFAPPQA